ncbi:hypothetical protein ACLBXM_08280 [Xanthobacteraceae bacterium A53D]
MTTENPAPTTEDAIATAQTDARLDEQKLDDAKLEDVNGGSELLAELGARIYNAIDKKDAGAFWDSPFSPTKLK